MSDAPGGMDEATLAGIDTSDITTGMTETQIGYVKRINDRFAKTRDANADLVAEVRRLSAALAEQQRETECARTALNEAFVEAEAEHADATARAHAAEAALADLRAKVEALPRRMLNTIDPAGDGYTVRIDCVNAVRGLLAAAPSGEPNTEENR